MVDHSKKKKKKKKKKSLKILRKENTAVQSSSDEINENDTTNIETLSLAFKSASLKEVNPAYKELKEDQNMLSREDQSTTCSTSSGNDTLGSSSSSVASESFGMVHNFVHKRKPRSKKVIAATGMVSTVLGKDYVRSSLVKCSSKSKGIHEGCNEEETEQFLYSMLGDECELSFAVVRDILGQCGYNLEMALDVLLEFSGTSKNQTNAYESTARKDFRRVSESNDSLLSGTSNSTFHSSGVQHENPWLRRNRLRNISITSGSHESEILETNQISESKVPQEVLESLFSMPTSKSAKHEPASMDWRNIVKKMISLAQRDDNCGSNQEPLVPAKGNEYLVLRANAQEHWESMRSYYQKAATAFSNGAKEHAAHLAKQGRIQNQMARDADEKASQDIFTARNKCIENVITIDLHGQHVKQAIRLLKLHLLFGACVRSVWSFEVITGCGRHGIGKSKLKNSVIDFLKKEGIAWSEVNQGKLLIRLDGQKELSFLDSDCEDE